MLKNMLDASPQKRLLSFNSSAEYCGVTQQTIRRLMARGVLTPVRLPLVQRILFDRRDLDRLIESGKAGDKGTEDAMPLAAVGVDDHAQEYRGKGGAGDWPRQAPKAFYGGETALCAGVHSITTPGGPDTAPHGGPMMPNFTTTPPSGASYLKSRLVDIGLEALSRGDWLVVSAVTTPIQKRGWSYA